MAFLPFNGDTMFLIHVFPMTASTGTAAEPLSYFSPNAFLEGDVVLVPLRKKKVRAVVVRCEPLREARARVRKEAFALKKIASAERVGFFAPEIMRAAQGVARFHAIGLGSALFHFTAQEVTIYAASEHAASAEAACSPIFIEMPRIARTNTYLTLAEKNPLVIVAPTIAELVRLQDTCRKADISVVTLHGGLTKKKFRDALAVLQHTQVLLATPQYAACARDDMHTLVMERESSELYRLRARGAPDTRIFLKALAHERSMQLVIGDMPLRTEIISENDMVERVDNAYAACAVPRIISMKQPKTAKEPLSVPLKKAIFCTISPEAEQAIETTLKAGNRALIWSARRGLAPVTVCNDCGARVACPTCGAPLVLHGSEKVRIYLCHACGKTHRSNILCKACGSWNLAGLGIGTERIIEEARTLFPNIPLLRFDSDAVKSNAEAMKLTLAFETEAPAIMIATDLALPYLRKPIAAVVVASLDTLLAIPAWNTYEHALGTLLMLRELAHDAFIVQTRHEAKELFAVLQSNDLAAFHVVERAARREFGYPPQNMLLKLSVSGNRREIARALPQMRTALSGITLVETLPPVKRGNIEEHALLARVPKGDWPDDAILKRLQALSPAVTITVNPLRVLG